MTVITLNDEQRRRVLYYETGFEQLHPVPEIHDWMTSLGFTYHSDWACLRHMDGSYVLEFINDGIAELFILKWL